MLPKLLRAVCLKSAAWLQRLGICVLVVVAVGCSGCAWFKPKDSTDINLREDPKETSIRPKREDGKHLYGGWSSEANAIERNLGY